MTTRSHPFGQRERGSSLVMVTVGSLVCMTIAISLVTARNQAMKLGVREQLAHLAQLDLEIQTSNLNHQVTSLLTTSGGYGGTINTSTLSNLVNNVTGVGSRVSNATNNESNLNFYQVGAVPVAGATPTPVSAALTPYTPQLSLLNGVNTFLPMLPDPADVKDPLSTVLQSQQIGTFTAQLQAAPASGTTVFYPGKTSSLAYKVRSMPITIYSVYALGNTTLTAASFPGDAGRIYAGQGLTVSGPLTATKPLIAQQTIAFDPADPTSQVSASGQSQSAAGGPGDAVVMTNGNQILQGGTQSKDVQSFTGVNIPAGLCVYNCAYALPPNTIGSTSMVPSTPPDPVYGAVSGVAAVNQAAVPPGMTPPSPMNALVGTALRTWIKSDSDSFNGAWDSQTLTNPPPYPSGYMAAVNTGGTRLMNGANTAPMQFIVLDYSHIIAYAHNLLTIPNGDQTIYIGGPDPTQQAVLLRGFAGTVWGGLTINSNLDIYISQGLSPDPSPLNLNPAISLITTGRFHVTN